jgi:hypothetical protein
MVYDPSEYGQDDDFATWRDVLADWRAALAVELAATRTRYWGALGLTLALAGCVVLP